MEQNRMEAGIEQDDFENTLRRRVLLEDRIDLFPYCAKHMIYCILPFVLCLDEVRAYVGAADSGSTGTGTLRVIYLGHARRVSAVVPLSAGSHTVSSCPPGCG